jgi:hypothetical protein
MDCVVRTMVIDGKKFKLTHTYRELSNDGQKWFKDYWIRGERGGQYILRVWEDDTQSGCLLRLGGNAKWEKAGTWSFN